MGEHQPCKPEVTGSNPVVSTIRQNPKIRNPKGDDRIGKVKNIYDTPVYDLPSRENGSVIARLSAGSVREVLSEHFNGWLKIAEGWIRPVKLEWIAA